MRWSILAVLVSVLVAISGCSDSHSSAPQVVVRVDNLMFHPMSVDVPVGGIVKWEFEDGALIHEVYSEGVFDSGPVSGGSYQHKFSSKGDINYHCQIHPYMTGVIHVR